MQKLKTKSNAGRRFIAGLIDYTLIYIFTVVFIFTWGEQTEDGEYILSGLSGLIPLASWGIITVGLEMVFGATIGNSLVGLKAIPKSGINRNLSFEESFLRHIADPIDMFFFGLVGFITIKTTPFNQRVGDLLAGTIVVRTKNLTKLRAE